MNQSESLHTQAEQAGKRDDASQRGLVAGVLDVIRGILRSLHAERDIVRRKRALVEGERDILATVVV
jgi:hypothetical protein